MHYTNARYLLWWNIVLEWCYSCISVLVFLYLRSQLHSLCVCFSNQSLSTNALLNIYCLRVDSKSLHYFLSNYFVWCFPGCQEKDCQSEITPLSDVSTVFLPAMARPSQKDTPSPKWRKKRADAAAGFGELVLVASRDRTARVMWAVTWMVWLPGMERMKDRRLHWLRWLPPEIQSWTVRSSVWLLTWYLRLLLINFSWSSSNSIFVFFSPSFLIRVDSSSAFCGSTQSEIWSEQKGASHGSIQQRPAHHPQRPDFPNRAQPFTTFQPKHR